MRLQVEKLGELALDFLFPKWCVGCGKRGDFVCTECIKHLSRIHGPLCPQCGRPQSDDILCPACLSWPAAIDGIRAPFRFEGAIRQAIYDLKYHNIKALARPLSHLIHHYLNEILLPGEILVPIPLHSKKLKERGYNQSALLAKELSKVVHLPVIEDCLIRQKHTAPQAKTVSVNERVRNVAGAFTCSGPDLYGRSVLLIDDVVTSGATFNAAAAVIKTCGALSVWGVALAKEI